MNEHGRIPGPPNGGNADARGDAGGGSPTCASTRTLRNDRGSLSRRLMEAGKPAAPAPPAEPPPPLPANLAAWLARPADTGSGPRGGSD